MACSTEQDLTLTPWLQSWQASLQQDNNFSVVVLSERILLPHSIFPLCPSESCMLM